VASKYCPYINDAKVHAPRSSHANCFLHGREEHERIVEKIVEADNDWKAGDAGFERDEG
jgi:hypothetical protein